MRRAITIATLCMLVGLYSIPVSADSPHYLRANANFSSSTACYSVDIKEAGLGNSGFSSITYTLSCSGDFTVVCVTKNGKNYVQGQPKSGSGTATTSTSLDVRNGQTNGTITICPTAFDLPDPGCTGSQTQYIIEAEYSGCSLSDGALGTQSPNLPDLGGSNLFVKP